MKGVKIRSQLHRLERYNCTGWSVEGTPNTAQAGA